MIFYHNDAQKAAAEKSKAVIGKSLSSPVVTEITSLKKFYTAEAYHQDYFRLNANQPYCRAVIRPKLEKLAVKLRQS